MLQTVMFFLLFGFLVFKSVNGSNCVNLQCSVNNDMLTSTGGTDGVPIIQPYNTLVYLIAVEGTFPQRNRRVRRRGRRLLSKEPFLGEIMLFAGDVVPRGWAQCDGTILPIWSNQALFSLLSDTYGGDGQTTFGLPDLRGRVPVHPGDGITLGEKGGNEAIFYTHIPVHTHGLSVIQSKKNFVCNNNTHWCDAELDLSVRDHDAECYDPIFNLHQPYIGINYIIALDGIFPNQGRRRLLGEAHIGEIKMFAGRFAPHGFAFCDGSTLSIAQYQQLFAVIGTIYGGNGRTTVGLPDMRGRAPVHDGGSAGFELARKWIGQKSGADTITINEQNLAPHRHYTSSASGICHAQGITQCSTNISPDVQTDSSGGGQPFSIEQPTLGINFVIATIGVTPSSGRRLLDIDPFTGQIMLFAGTFAPVGYMFCNGQSLGSNYESLHSVLRNTFGEFVPDLRGRIAIHRGGSIGLSNYPIAQKGGSNTQVMTASTMHTHSHVLQPHFFTKRCTGSPTTTPPSVSPVTSQPSLSPVSSSPSTPSPSTASPSTASPITSNPTTSQPTVPPIARRRR